MPVERVHRQFRPLRGMLAFVVAVAFCAGRSRQENPGLIEKFASFQRYFSGFSLGGAIFIPKTLDEFKGIHGLLIPL
jgi:hypothetical protein